MDPKLQRRVQRYGWDLASDDYEALWQAQLAGARSALLVHAAPGTGERVLDVACGTGLVAFAAAHAVGPTGRVVGIDVSGRMIDAARARAETRQMVNTDFLRMDAEQLALPDGAYDLALCALGLMYLPSPERALDEMRRVLRPGGRLGLVAWGARSRCGWSSLFPIVDAEVSSDVCPLFFQLGQPNALANLCAAGQFENIEQHRIVATLNYADADEACRAAFVGGPVALAWSRFDDAARQRVRSRYLESISEWQHESGYRIPVEFIVVAGTAPGATGSESKAMPVTVGNCI